MLDEPRCWTRECINYIGVGTQNTKAQGKGDKDINYCSAFSLQDGGIPDEIAYGDNLHLKSIKDQDNDIVFEKIQEV